METLKPLCLAFLLFVGGSTATQPRALLAQQSAKAVTDVGVKEHVKVSAARAVNLPDSISVAVGRMASIEVGDPDVGWKIVGDEVDSFREYDPAKIKIRVIGYKPSVAWLVVADKQLNITACKIIVGEPVPPTPPVPPVPPPPPDPLAGTLQAAYASDLSPTKAADKATLAAIYRGAVANLPTLKTMGDWSTFMGTAIKSAGLVGKLSPVQRAIGDEFNARLPRTPTAPVDAALVGAQLTRMAALLEAIK